MTEKISPRNRMAQLHHRALGNPANTLPTTAISNCFPGLEYDFKNFWRRAFVGIVLQEWDNLVVGIEDEQYRDLMGHRLLRVADRDIVTTVSGPYVQGGASNPLGTGGNPNALISMEWSNALAFVMQHQGRPAKCQFTSEPAGPVLQPTPTDPDDMLEVSLTVRRALEENSAVPAADLLHPGELTQGLCSPWQHDYRECACYYWPASRPDYVNVEPGPGGVSVGDNWMSKERTGQYVLDDRVDSRVVSYDDLFRDWEKMLCFQIKGRDSAES
jgi:hypothetical protein